MTRRPAIFARFLAFLTAIAIGAFAGNVVAHAQDGYASTGKTLVADIPTGSSRAEVIAATRRTVRSIIDYTRWPDGRAPGTLCVIGDTKYGSNLANISLRNGEKLSVKSILAGSSDLQGCDTLYLGQINMQQMRATTGAVRGKPVLTIAENDPDCRSQSMFCLTYGSQTMTFRLNIDSISRSPIRVDPRVLRLSKGGMGG